MNDQEFTPPVDELLVSPFLTLREAAAYARCSPRTIQRRVDAGALTRYGFGRSVLIRRAELELLLSPTAAPMPSLEVSS